MQLDAITRIPYFEYAQKGANEAYKFFKFAVADVTRLVSKSDAADSALRIFEEVIKFRHLRQKAGEYTSPMLDKIVNIRAGIGFCRIAQSVKYIVSGELYKDCMEKNVRPVITEAAFLLARVSQSVDFFVHRGMGSWASLAKSAASYGRVPAFAVAALRNTTAINCLWTVALTGLLIPEVNALRTNAEKRDVHLYYAVALSADIVALALSIVGIQAQSFKLGLGFIAASTSILGYFADSDNVVTKGYK